MKLQEQLNAYKKRFEETVPKDALEIMHRATENLYRSGILDRTVKVGDKAPGFLLKNTMEAEVSLPGLLSNGPLVLSFYRGKW